MEKDTPAQERISQILMYAGILTHCMCYFNSAINPIIYYFMSAQFKVRSRFFKKRKKEMLIEV